MNPTRVWAERAFGESLRFAERRLPTWLLKALLLPAAMVIGSAELLTLACIATWYRRHWRLPSAVRANVLWWRWACRMWISRVILSLARFLRYWPERLREDCWATGCRYFGKERLTAALATGRPIVLATLHYGDLTELYHRLRAEGLAVAFIAGRNLSRRNPYRAYLNSLADQANGLQGVPHYFAPSQLWEARDFFLGSSRILAVALERLEGGQHIVAQGAGFRIRVAPGALRLAAIVDAVVLPCVINECDAPTWMGCTIHFGTPVPDDFVTRRDGHAKAFAHILQELSPWLLARPELCQSQLRAALQSTQSQNGRKGTQS